MSHKRVAISVFAILTSLSAVAGAQELKLISAPLPAPGHPVPFIRIRDVENTLDITTIAGLFYARQSDADIEANRYIVNVSRSFVIHAAITFDGEYLANLNVVNPQEAVRYYQGRGTGGHEHYFLVRRVRGNRVRVLSASDDFETIREAFHADHRKPRRTQGTNVPRATVTTPSQGTTPSQAQSSAGTSR